MLKQPCRFYNATGKCHFGKRCKFLHDINISQTQSSTENQKDEELNQESVVERSVSESSEVESTQQTSNNQDEGLKHEVQKEKLVGRKLCTFYSEQKYCRYGHRCRFAHILSNEDGGGNDLKAADEPDGKLNKNDLLNEVEPKQNVSQQKGRVGKIDAVKKNKKKLCRYFKQGYCRLGSRCHFFHPAKNNEEQQVSSVAGGPEPQAEVQQEDSIGGEWQPVARHMRVINVYQRDDITEEKLKELREIEIRQLKRRFPVDKVKIMSETDEMASFIFTFMPTDPDWPYDVKEFDIQVDFGQKYPLKLFDVSLPLDQDLPATVLQYIDASLKEWVVKKEEEHERKGIVELLFRPFLRWMDRNMETIVTEGLKQLQRELRAQAAGLQFISAKELTKNPVTGASSESCMPEEPDEFPEKDDRRPVVYRKGDIMEETYQPLAIRGDDENHSSDSSSPSDDDDDDEGNNDDEHGNDNKDDKVHLRPTFDPDTPRSGTEVSLKNMQMWYLTTVLMEKLKIVIQCERCKNKTDFSTPPNRVNSVACTKCGNVQLVVFRPVLAHAYSSTVGYLDLDGCTAFDIILQDCHMSVGCIRCSRDALLKKLVPGRQNDFWCRGCHTKMKFSFDSVKLSLLTSDGIDSSKFSGKVHTVRVRRNARLLKDPAIREGQPLPNNGACKHYKKSFRWLRFPCCGKTYPCDLCHDDKEDHEMKFANRMICGFCCKEQPFAAEKPCSGCSSALTKVRTSHWEGGRGCRDKISMSRSDDKKYTNINKTVSNKAKAAQEKNKGKKTIKLRHT